MSAHLVGLATATPDGAMTQLAAAEHAATRCCHTDAQTDVLTRLYDRSGVLRRAAVAIDGNGFYPAPVNPSDRGPTTGARMVRFDEEATALASIAATQAMADAAIDADAVTHLVTVSCTGFGAPGFDIGLVRSLPLPSSVPRVHVGFMGCHGALNGLRVATAIAEADRRAVVLLCAVELCSLHFAYGWRSQSVVANALFADGAAAAVITADPARTENAIWSVLDAASTLLPDSDAAMRWSIGDHGFEMTLSPRLPDIVHAYLPGWVASWLDRHGYAPKDVRAWAPHPGGPRVLDAIEASLGLDRDDLAAARGVLADHGNMSSPTVLFVLDRLRRGAAGTPCVGLAFGPGITIEGVLLEDAATSAG